MALILPSRENWIGQFRRNGRSMVRQLLHWFGDIRARPRGAWRRQLVWWRLNTAMRFKQRQAFVLWYGPATTFFSRVLAPSSASIAELAARPDKPSDGRVIDGSTELSRLQETSFDPEKYFLFADRHRLYFWMGGVIGSAVLFFGRSIHPIPCEQFSWNATWVINLVLHPATFFLLLSFYVAPFFVYVACRRSVLDQISMQLPDRFMPWMRVCVNRRRRRTSASSISGKKRQAEAALPFLDTLKNCLRPVWMVATSMTPGCSGRSKLAVAYDGLDSRPGRLTRIATTEFFNPRSGDSETRAIGRWLFYGLAPLWVFVLLMTTVLIAAALTEGFIHRHELLLLDVAWVFLALVFFVVETPRMPVDLGVKPDDLAFLPSQIVLPKDALASVITDRLFRLTLNAAVTIIAVVYATLAALIDTGGTPSYETGQACLRDDSAPAYSIVNGTLQ